MAVDQPRHDRAATGVDPDGFRSDEGFDLGGGTDSRDPVPGDRDGFRDRAPGIDRDHLAPGDREVGGRGHQAPTAKASRRLSAAPISTPSFATSITLAEPK